MIIFGQGAIRSHPWVLKEFQAVAEEDQEKALKAFDHALLGHAGYMVANIARTLLLGLTRGRFSKTPAEATVERVYYQRLNWMSAAFALCADAAMMTLGGTLKRKERLSARLGDLLSELYLCSAVLKRFHDEGRQDDDLPLLHWAMQQSLYSMQQSLRSLFRNLPLRPLAWALRLLVFPTGYPFHEADDELDSKIANLLLSPSNARDRLTDGIFMSTDRDEPVGQLEAALDLSVKLDAVEKIISSARKEGRLRGSSAEEIFQSAHAEELIDDQQFDQLLLLEELRNKVIAVDSFKRY
jgi:acyl-CoA dehydrogenase